MSTTSLFRSAAFLRAALLCGALTACGGGGGDAPAPAPAPNPPAPAPVTHAYLLHQRSVEVCQIDSNGLLVGCADAGVSGYQGMYAITVNDSHAYIANLGNPDTGEDIRIIHCSIGAAGHLSACAETGPTGLATDLSTTDALVINGSTVYIGDRSALHKCDVKEDGSLDNCVSSDVPADMGQDVKDVQVVGTTAYLLHEHAGQVSRCKIEPDASVSGCVDAVVEGLNLPRGLTVAGSHMYIANTFGQNVIRCVVGPDGPLSDCRDAGGSGFFAPDEVVVRGSMVYIIDGNAQVGLTRCTATSEGLLTACTTTPSTSSLSDIDIR